MDSYSRSRREEGEYRKHASNAVSYFKEFGATRQVEAWGDDVPDGKVTDFKRSVKAKPDETIVFSWVEYPDKATRDKANKKMMQDPRMQEMGNNMPFDGKRMIFAGFTPINDSGESGKIGYIDGCVIPVPSNKRMRIASGPTNTRPSSRNTAPRARSMPGATACRTARSPISRAR